MNRLAFSGILLLYQGNRRQAFVSGERDRMMGADWLYQICGSRPIQLVLGTGMPVIAAIAAATAMIVHELRAKEIRDAKLRRVLEMAP